MVEKYEHLLNKLYKNSAACYTSLMPLLHEARKHNKNITKKHVENYLKTQHTYTLHRRVGETF